ncbi:MAG: hypothetical protein ACKVOK_05525 [Flavobacteriales bacterium]
MKKSNLLLLGFYLTLLLSFLGYLLAARNYIDEHFEADKDVFQIEAQEKIIGIDVPINHLIVQGNRSLQRLSLGKTTQLRTHSYGGSESVGYYEVYGDVLYILGEMQCVEIQFANKLKSVRMVGSYTDVETGILEANADVYFIDGSENIQNLLYCDEGKFQSLNIYLENSLLMLTQHDKSMALTMDSLHVTMMNSNFEFDERTGIEIGAIEIHSFNAENRISVPSDYLEKIRQIKHYMEDYHLK